jgi:hypothetical protein
MPFRFSLKALSSKLTEKSTEGGDGPDEEEGTPKRSFLRKLSDSFRCPHIIFCLYCLVFEN